MTADRDITVTVLVLRKAPYIGNKTIAHCLSSERGKMAFFLRGSEGGKTTHGQPFDLFRLLSVNCHRNSSDLYYPDSVEILADYPSLASDYASYDTGCQLLDFAFRNTQPGLDSSKLFMALNVALKRLAERTISPDAIVTGCNMVFLFEAGQLDYGNASDRERHQQEVLLRMALGGDVPQLADDVWRKLREWSDGLILNLDL